MKTQILYTYLGTNGTLTTPIHLENIYAIKKIKLIAENGTLLTKNGIDKFSEVIIEEDEKDKWYEVLL